MPACDAFAPRDGRRLTFWFATALQRPIKQETVCSRVRCRTCKDLLLLAIRAIERGELTVYNDTFRRHLYLKFPLLPYAGQGKTAISSLSSSTGKGAHAAPVLSRLNGGLFVPGVGPASPLLLTAAGGAGGGASPEGAALNGTGTGADAATAVTTGGEEPMGFASFHVSMIVI